MNASRPPAESPDRYPDRSVHLERELERRRAGEWQAIEALEGGDQAGATDILLALTEDDLTVSLRPRLCCPECELALTWPGELEVHRLVVHGVELRDAA
jgi:hypothetical protein